MKFGVTFYALGIFMLAMAILPALLPISITVVLITFLIYSALAYAINFITGMTGYVSFGHVVFMGVGSYTLGASAKTFHLDPLLGIMLGATMGLLLAIGVGAATLRFRGVYFAIATLVVALATLNIVLATPQLGESQGIVLNLGFQPLSWYYSIWVIVLIEMFLTYFINRSKIGLGIRAIKSDEDAAKSLGVNAPRLKLYVFMLSGLFAGAAGSVFTWSTSGVFPYITFDLTFSLQMLAMIIIGGMGTSLGPLIGALIVYLPSYYFLTVVVGAQLIIIGLLVVLVALFVSEGIVGTLRRRFASLRRVLE